MTAPPSPRCPWFRGPIKVIKVYRSLDDGRTWSLWSTLGTFVFAADYMAPTLHMARGTNPRLFLGFIIFSMNGFQVRVAYTDPSAETPTWTTQTLTDLGNMIDFFDIGSTADFQTDYSVFVVTSRSDGGEIRFARSANKGVTWNASYVTTIPSFGYEYHLPKMAVGLNGVSTWRGHARDPRRGDRRRTPKCCTSAPSTGPTTAPVIGNRST